MTSIEVDNPLEDQDVVREDDSPWPFALVQEERTVLADHARDIVAYLIDGYNELPDGDEGRDQALLARWETAVTVATDVQSLVCADRTHEGLFDPAQETETTLSALFQPKSQVIDEDVTTWDHPHVPLVLVTTDYAPFISERPPVTGNVWWVDPSDETSFLRSLANLGVIEFFTHDDA